MTNRTPQRITVGSRWREFSNPYRALCAVLALLQLFLPSLVVALPSDGNVVGGHATIQQVNPHQLDIQQTTDKAILNWKSFSIAGDETVHFMQPSVHSIALNRVVGTDPSVILGHLQSNGRIFLLNPNGILFGAGAQIDVGGLLATTLQIRDDDFMAGRYLFAQDPLKGLRTVINRGTIQVSDHGFVFLAAPGVSNEGLIVANLGTVVLGSGQALTVDLMGDGLINYALSGKVLDHVMGVDGKPLSSAVSNTGTIQADGGHVVLQAKAAGEIFSSVVNQSGVIRARSLESHGGVVQLLGGDETLVAVTAAGAMRPAGDVSGAVVNTGSIDVAAGAPNAAQGSVTMVGERVGQFGSIVATGAEGVTGGDVVIASTARALLASGSTIDVSGIGHSSGGRLRVWSDHNTFFDSGATILARGGELGGNGGFVELSGKETLGFAGMVNALAPFGSAGTLLLDPRSITIATAGGVAYNNGLNNLFGNNVGATTIITPASINGQLANVILQANTDITVTNVIAMTNAGVGITMQAGRSIAVNANVSTTNGNISLTANDSAATAADRLVGAGNITMAGGTTLNAGTGSLSLTIDPSAVGGFTPGTITAQTLAGGAKTITTATGTSIVNGVISGVGGLTKNGVGALTLSGNNTYTGTTSINAGTLQLGAANRIANTNAVTVNAGATFNLNNFAETIGSLSGAGTVTLGSATLTTGDATNTTFSGVMSGTGGLTKAGTGVFTLSGANTYTGATAINAGTLQVAGGSAIADTSAVTLANVAGAILDLNGTNETIGSLAGGGATGGNVTLGIGTLTAGGNNGTTTYTGILSGTGGLMKQGTGIFTLSGANTYTGATTINAGTLQLGAANRIADASAVTVGGGAIFNLNNFAETIGSLTGAGNVTLGTGTLTAGGDNTATTYSGVMSGTGGLTKAGTGVFTLSGNNTYTGATTINAGTVQLGAADRIANTSAVTVAGGATFDLNNFAETIGSLAGAGNVTLGTGILTAGGNNTSTAYSGVVSGTGGLTKAGTGIFTLSGANTYTGATAINAGTLTLGAANRIADASAVSVAGGATFNLNNFAETIGSLAGAGNVTLGTGILTAGGDNSSSTFSGVMSGTGGLTKQGTGTFTLSGANTYTGATTINAGTVQLGAADRIANTSAVTVAGGAAFDLNNFIETIGSLSGAGDVSLGTGTLTTGGNNTSTIYSGVMSGTGGLTKAGTGIFTLSGANTYTGATAINAGTLQVAGGSAIADTSAVTLANVAGAILDLNGTNETIGSLAGGGATGGNVTLGIGTLTAGGNNGTTTYTGILSGTGGLMKQGTGIFTLSGANTYTGATTINAGTLQLGAANRIANTSAVTVNAGATFNLNNFAETIGSLSGAGNVTLGSATLTTGDATNTAFSGVMSGTGGLTKAGTGVFTLSGMNTYTGATAINAGTLQVAGGAAIADTSAVTLANVAGATLDLNGTNETVGSLAGGGALGGNVTLGAGMLTTGGNNAATTYSGIMSGTGGLTKAGTGIFTLSGANTYTGATTINAGTLTLGAANRIADASALTVAGGATFNLNNFAETIGSLAGAGNVTLGTGTLTAGGDNSFSTFSGVMSGTGGLTKQGTGIFTLSGNNTYTGATNVNAGTLVAAVNNALGTVAGGTTVASGATLGFSGGINYSTAESVTLNTGATLSNLAGNNIFAGPISLAAGSETITSAVGTTLTANGVISGAGALTKDGTGTLIYGGVNTYTGTTSINAGTLQLGAANRIANTNAVTVNAGATFNLNNFAETIGSLSGAGTVTLGSATLTTGDATNTTFSGVMSGTGGLTKAGTGVFTLSGANTYTGATAINAGTLQVAGGSAIADTSAVTLANVAGAILDLNGTNETIGSLAGGGATGGNVTLGIGTLTAGGNNGTTTYTGILSGTGGLMKQGTGIFTLSGANTYTGATTINAGTLQLGAANRIADASAVTVGGGAIFNLNNFAETIGSLTGAGNVTLGTGTLTAGGDNTATTYSGVMSGTGGLTKAGTGVFTLSGNNTYTGTTNVNAGTLVAAANNALGTAAGGTTVAAGATLGLAGGINYSTVEPVTLSGGTLSNLVGNNTFTGPITLAANSAFAVADGTTMTVGGTVNGGSQLTISSGTGGINFLSAIGGTTPLSSLSVTVGSIALGPVTTVGTQTYTGATTLNGNLTTTNSAITLNSPVTLGANVAMNAGNGAIAMNGTVNGAFTLTANSTGTTTFTGAVGNSTALTSLTTNIGGTTAINGGSVTTSGNQTYNDNVTMNQATTLTSTGGTVTFGGNATNNAAGAALTVDAPTINLTGGTTIATTGNGPINFFTDTLNPNGASINAGTAAFALSPNTLTNTIEFGDVNTGRVTNVYYGSNFGSVTAGSFTIGRATHTGNIFVTGVAAAPSAINIVNGGTGSVAFETAPYVSGNNNFGVVGGSGGITIGSSLTLGTGTLRLTTTGAITQTAGSLTADTAGLSAASGINVVQPANNVTTLAAQTTAGDLAFTDTNGFTIDSISATVDGFHPAITDLAASAGSITLQSGGAVTQTQRIVAATLNLQGSGPYTLTSGANDVATLAANTTGNVQYNNANALALGASTVSGSFDVTTGGAITQTGAVTVTGTTTLAAGAASDVTLTNAGNDFSTVGITSGNNVSLTDTNALVLGASTVSGNLNITTNGTLTQSGAATVAGTATLAAGAANDVTLTNTGNDFSIVGITSSNNVSLTDSNALVLDASTISGNLALTTGGTLSQTGALAVTGTTSFTTTAANTDVLLDTQANNFGGVVGFAGTQTNLRDVQLRNVNAGATVPVLVGLTNLRNLTLTFDNVPITLSALSASGNLSITAGGSINQSGAMAIGGTTTLTTTVAGSDILLDTQPNNLMGAVSFGGTVGNIRDLGLRNVNAGATIPSLAGLTNLRNLTLTFDNAPIALPALTLTAGGNLNVTAGGSITQTGAITVPGITTLATTVAGSDILFDTQANNFGGAVAFGGAQVNIRDIGLRNINAGATVPTLVGVTNLRNLTLQFDNAPITLPTLTASGNVNATAGGTITQSGAAMVAGTTALAAGVNDITLTNAGNNFSTVGITSGTNVSVTDANTLNLGASTIGGTLNVTTGGALTQSGVLTVAGATTLTSGANDITLTNGGNNFSTIGIASGNNVSLTDANALVLGTSTVTGNFNVTNGGALTQSGALNVTGITTLAGGANDITLNNAGNNFSAVGVTSGNNVTLTDANALTMNTSTVSGNIAVSANDLTLGGPVVSTGGNITLTGVNTVTQSANLTAAGANTVTVTTTTGSITMAAAATTSSGTGTISYTAGTNVTLGSLSTGGGVNVSAGGSVLSVAGSGTNVTAGANSTLQALNGVVGTQAAPMTVNVNPGTLSIRATTAVAGVSAFLTGTVLPGNALTRLNVPPGLVCFNGCTVPPPSNNPFAGVFGLAPSFNLDSVVPWYLHEPSDPPVISVVSTYLPQTVIAEAKTDVKSDNQSVAREIPPCFPESACKPGASILAAPADGGDPELPAAK